MKNSVPILLIAGAGSGVGKTSLTLGLAAALRRRGLVIQTFKVGPDYLDPTHLARASGRACYNLDGWMTGRDYVRRLASTKSQDADLAIVEGVMGLYDGASPSAPAGSTAEIARWLNAPVLLVLNAHGAARSLAAIVHGFATFPGAPRIAGVIANHTGSPRHGELLRQALDSLPARPPPLFLGGIPRGAFPELAGRHLGLVAATAKSLPQPVLAALADACEKHLDLAAILRLLKAGQKIRRLKGLTPASPQPRNAPISNTREPDRAPAKTPRAGRKPPQSIRMGLAQDAAFHFHYPDNLELLENAGIILCPFSPLKDRKLPAGIGGVWLGGGYPEEHAAELAGNRAMLAAIRKFAGGGGAVYAECGGLMYLADSLADRAGKVWPMAGVIPIRVRMLSKYKRLGYAAVQLKADCLLGRAGTRLRGHEFHYSEVAGARRPAGWPPAYTVTYRDGRSSDEGYCRGRILAGYVHLHLASRPAAAQRLARLMRHGV